MLEEKECLIEKIKEEKRLVEILSVENQIKYESIIT